MNGTEEDRTAYGTAYGTAAKAQEGCANFTGLTLVSKPGSVLRLTFGPAVDGQTSIEPFTVSVSITSCWAGQSVRNLTDGMVSCEQCNSPVYSLEPNSPKCYVCPEHAVCDGPLMRPVDGYWQSHPRSIQVGVRL